MAKTKTTTHPWDITRYLESDEDIAAYLDAALEEDGPALLAAASPSRHDSAVFELRPRGREDQGHGGPRVHHRSRQDEAPDSARAAVQW